MEGLWTRAVATLVALALGSGLGEAVYSTDPDLIKLTFQQPEPSKLPAQLSASGSSIPDPFVDGWPRKSALHLTNRLGCGIYSNGRIASPQGTEIYEFAFVYPPSSGINYLYHAFPLIGGIRDADTLVSSTNDLDGFSVVPDFVVPESPYLNEGLSPLYSGLVTAFRSHFVDTIDLRPTWARPLRSQGVSVVQKSYSEASGPWSNILLVDFTVTNRSAGTIRDMYIGFYVDGDVCSSENGEYNYECFHDDLTGTLRDIGTAYIIDNDGDPQGGYFLDHVSPIDGLALRPTMVYPPVTDTTFNWWVYDYPGPPFHPRKRGTADDPFREYEYSSWGVPWGDSNQYYIMRHDEWDYDQYLTASIDSTDNIWLYPGNYDSSDYRYLAKGADTKFLLSLGPVNLLPDSSMRAVFALFGTDFVHVDPANGARLLAGDYEGFYEHLQFDLTRRTAKQALDFTHYVLDPARPPTGLKLDSFTPDTAVLSWDARVLPDIDCYRLYITPVDARYMIASGVAVRPDHPIDMGHSFQSYLPHETTARITGLRPGQLYFAAIAHVSESGEGELSAPIVVGYETLDSVVMDREFVFWTEGDSTVTLTWEPTDDSAVRYYRIYRVRDTSEVRQRFYPAATNDPSLFSIPPEYCREIDSDTYCYYEMQPYDSTKSNIGYYRDPAPIDGACYWVAPVGQVGYPGRYSAPIICEKAPAAQKEVVVVLGSKGGLQDYVLPDSLVDFYDRLLNGYDYDIYNWKDTNLSYLYCDDGFCTDWRDLAKYELVIVEEFPSPQVLTAEIESKEKVFTRILNSGRDIVYFGTPPGNETVNLRMDKDTIRYSPTGFETRYLDLTATYIKSIVVNYPDSPATDKMAGFNQAVSVTANLPGLRYDPAAQTRMTSGIKIFFNTADVLPMTGAFECLETTEVLYQYGSLYQATSELQGLPCGILARHASSRAYVFSFHLWAIEETAARELIDYIMENRSRPGEEPPPPLPTRFSLYQNYPNPFNSATRIAFDLPRPGHAKLEIYNILGQRVATILDRDLTAGTHTVEWHGTDNAGRTVASGVYLYRLTTRDGKHCRKMLLLK